MFKNWLSFLSYDYCSRNKDICNSKRKSNKKRLEQEAKNKERNAKRAIAKKEKKESISKYEMLKNTSVINMLKNIGDE